MMHDADIHGYRRWHVANGHLRDRWRRHEEDAGEQSVEERLISAYLDHQVKRRLFQYLIAGANGEAALGQLIDVVVQLSFSVLLSQDRDELEDALKVRTRVCLAPAYALPGERAVLGGMQMGGSVALGTSCADAGTAARIDVALGAGQLVRLYRHPWVLRHLVRALDSVVPIEFDFTVRFGLRAGEGEFRLGGGSEDEASFLGMTTALAGQSGTRGG